jgi:hypothetical protein
MKEAASKERRVYHKTWKRCVPSPDCGALYRKLFSVLRCLGYWVRHSISRQYLKGRTSKYFFMICRRWKECLIRHYLCVYVCVCLRVMYENSRKHVKQVMWKLSKSLQCWVLAFLPSTVFSQGHSYQHYWGQTNSVVCFASVIWFMLFRIDDENCIILR